MKNAFFISTAIDYPSAPPHVGHMYEKICADVIARYQRLKGLKVHFSTGLDCHGLKIQRAAEKQGKKPEEFVKEMSKFFLQLCKEYSISYDDFIMTTEKRHKKVVNYILKKMYAKKEIYKGEYEGLYCVDCETFYTETESENKNCPVHKKPLEIVKEKGYFFKMSKYKSFLLNYIKKNKDYIIPIKRGNEIINRLKEEVKDLNITREKVKWGLTFQIDKKLTIAVWTEALINYLTTINYPKQNYKKFWPGVHVIGNDISWHHIVIWGSMLKALDLKLPQILIHGFIKSGGEKLSKSRGIVINPLELSKNYPTDAIRYFLIREIPFGEDGDFSEEAIKTRLNNELANDLGNLVSRTLSLVQKNFKILKKTAIDKKLESQLDLKKINNYIDNFELHHALAEIWKFINNVNKYINQEKPWELKGKELEKCLYTIVESLRIISILLYPFIPETSEKINKQLGIKLGKLKDCKFGLVKEYRVKKGDVLFKKI
jgi:methionyl-tRNA synthetase